MSLIKIKIRLLKKNCNYQKNFSLEDQIFDNFLISNSKIQNIQMILKNKIAIESLRKAIKKHQCLI